jgi:hypothetical protein
MGANASKAKSSSAADVSASTSSSESVQRSDELLKILYDSLPADLLTIIAAYALGNIKRHAQCNVIFCIHTSQLRVSTFRCIFVMHQSMNWYQVPKILTSVCGAVNCVC